MLAVLLSYFRLTLPIYALIYSDMAPHSSVIITSAEICCFRE